MVSISYLYGLLMWQPIYKTIVGGKVNGNLVLVHEKFIKIENSFLNLQW
jgi:hypothetical protein